MDISLATFMGFVACLFFTIGRGFGEARGTEKTQDLYSALLTQMNKDMDGAIKQWFEDNHAR